MTNAPKRATVQLTQAELHYLRCKVWEDEIGWTKAKIAAQLSNQPLQSHERAAYDQAVHLGQMLAEVFKEVFGDGSL